MIGGTVAPCNLFLNTRKQACTYFARLTAMIIGIDVGTKQSGVAVSDAENKVAFPRRTIATADLLSFVGTMIVTEKVTEVILGHSVDNKGKENQVMKVVREIETKLKNEHNVNVHLMSESYTSQMALRHVDFNKKDEAAAALILQTWLDREKNNCSTDSKLA